MEKSKTMVWAFFSNALCINVSTSIMATLYAGDFVYMNQMEAHWIAHLYNTYIKAFRFKIKSTILLSRLQVSVREQFRIAPALRSDKVFFKNKLLSEIVWTNGVSTINFYDPGFGGVNFGLRLFRRLHFR